jgi:hypothetical protein
MMILAQRSCLRPRIGRSRAFSRPWSASMRLFWVLLGVVPGGWDQLVEHDRVSRRLVGGHLGGVTLVTLVVLMACWKNRRAALASRRGETNTSMTWLNWSAARYT